jgi:hypothetical protein
LKYFGTGVESVQPRLNDAANVEIAKIRWFNGVEVFSQMEEQAIKMTLEPRFPKE